MSAPRASIGRRLAFYAALEIAVVAALVGLALSTLLRIDRSVAFIARYGKPPVEAVGRALIDNGEMLDRASFGAAGSRFPLERAALEAHVATLSALERQYRVDWTVRDSTSADAEQARRTLAAVGRLQLIDEEGQAIDRFDAALGRLRSSLGPRELAARDEIVAALSDVQNALRGLRIVSTTWVDVQTDHLADEVAHLRTRLVWLSFVGVALVVITALQVRTLIVPRLGRIVKRVREFQRRGVYGPIQDVGGDEITVLANAVDAGFSAIVERDRERQRFLAVAAHELKTPLSAILGFAQVALRSPEDAALARRALGVVERHAVRLARVIDDVFLAASARDGSITMTTERVDVGAALRKIVAELELGSSTRTIVVEPFETVVVLGDATLIDHALWLLLAFALHAAKEAPVRVRVAAEDGSVRIRVSFVGSSLTPQEREQAFAPMGTLAFEGNDVPRAGMGLFLCREVARLHRGSMHIDELASGETYVEVELRA